VTLETGFDRTSIEKPGYVYTLFFILSMNYYFLFPFFDVRGIGGRKGGDKKQAQAADYTRR
jgi:hypothetical protein